MHGCKIRLLVHDVRNGIGVNHANDETEWVRKYAVGVAGARSKSRRAGQAHMKAPRLSLKCLRKEFAQLTERPGIGLVAYLARTERF